MDVSRPFNKMANKVAISKQLKPVNTANFLPFNFAIIAAGIEPAATPKIINVMGSVARDLLGESSLDNSPPIKTIIGAEHITRGCAMNSKLIFLGKLNCLVRKSAEITISTITIKMVIIINQIPLLILF